MFCRNRLGGFFMKRSVNAAKALAQGLAFDRHESYGDTSVLTIMGGFSEMVKIDKVRSKRQQ